MCERFPKECRKTPGKGPCPVQGHQLGRPLVRKTAAELLAAGIDVTGGLVVYSDTGNIEWDDEFLVEES